MRRFESYVVILGMYACWTPMLPGDKWPSVALIICLALHFLLERPRWQLYLAYATTLYTAIYVIAGEDNSVAWGVIAEILLLISATAACLMPVAKLPVPTGPFKTIGVVSRHVDDPNTRGEMKGGMMVKTFYPAKAGSKGRRMKFTSSEVAGGIAKYINMPEFMFGHLPLAYDNALENVPIAANEAEHKFPVLVFSHGLGGHADVYTVVAEEIASHGYIVVVPTHNDLTAAYNEFPDGRILPYRPPNSLTDDAFETNKVWRNGQIKNRCVEIRWLIDMMHAPNQLQLWGPILANRFDTNRIGIGGHSFGACTALCVTAEEPRIRCCITDDLWLTPAHQSVLQTGVPKIPMLFLISHQWVQWNEHQQQLKDLLAKCNHPGSLLLGIKDSRHSNFDDTSMFSPLISRKLTATGSIDLKRGYRVAGRYHTAFLNTHLKSLPSEMDRQRGPVPGEMASAGMAFDDENKSSGSGSEKDALDRHRCSKHWPEIMWLGQSQPL